MFAPIKKPVSAIIAIVITSLLIVSCGSSTKDYGHLIEQAPKWQDSYVPGNHPTERESEYRVPLQVCPSSEKVDEFITNFYDPEHATLASRTLVDNAYYAGGYKTAPNNGHISNTGYFEDLIFSMNVECLPPLDGSIEYKPGQGNEEIRTRWLNFEGTYALAHSNFRQILSDLAEERGGSFMFATGLTTHTLSDEDFEEVMNGAMDTPEYRLMIDYNYSLQLLGIVSALSGGMLFDSYNNPAMAEPEFTLFTDTGDNRNWYWNTEPVQENNRIELAYTGEYEDDTAPREPVIENFR